MWLWLLRRAVGPPNFATVEKQRVRGWQKLSSSKSGSKHAHEMAKPVYFQQTLRIIKTLRGLPSKCTNSCGYTAAEIAAAHNSFFPSDPPLTTESANLYLRKGVSTGVFLFGGCQGTITSLPSCSTANAANRPIASQTYLVNAAMAGLNPLNQAYVLVGYQDDPLQKRPGYLPCGACTDSADPYAASVDRGGAPNPNLVGFSVSASACGADICTVTTVS